MAAQLVGQFDPAMTSYMTETQELYRSVFGTANEHTLLVDGTARAGIEAALVSPRAAAAIMARSSVEAGLREPGDPVSTNPIRSNYFDLSMLFDHWGPKRLNHHTEATTMLYGARECARLLVDEGLPQAVDRHHVHGSAMLVGVQSEGGQLRDQNSVSLETAYRSFGLDPVHIIDDAVLHLADEYDAEGPDSALDARAATP